MRRWVKVFLWLLVIQIVFAIAWPQSERDKTAAAIAHSICSRRATLGSRPLACVSTSPPR